jgi:hypothetical protein
LALVPGGDQALGVLKNLSIGRSTSGGLFFGGVAALVLHFAAVDAHDRIVAEAARKSITRRPARPNSTSLRFSDFYRSFGGHHTVVTGFGSAVRDGEALGVQSTAEQFANRRSSARHVTAKSPIIDGNKLVLSEHDLQTFAPRVSHDGPLSDIVAQATTLTQLQLR